MRNWILNQKKTKQKNEKENINVNPKSDTELGPSKMKLSPSVIVAAGEADFRQRWGLSTEAETKELMGSGAGSRRSLFMKDSPLGAA